MDAMGTALRKMGNLNLDDNATPYAFERVAQACGVNERDLRIEYADMSNAAWLTMRQILSTIKGA